MPRGVIAIAKPAGITSHDVVAQVRRLLGQPKTKVGHTGTLDPFATGVLIVAIGQATRLIRFSHDWPKAYEATATCGATSTTDDLTGELTVVQKTPERPTAETLQQLTQQFTGEIDQLPPAYAAIKVGGKKLYEYARAGEEAPRKPRKVTIHSLSLDDTAWPELSLTVTCGSGTYIRSLARDIGQELGSGAHLTRLTRTSVGPFTLSVAVELSELTSKNIEGKLAPADVLVASLPQQVISPAQAEQLSQGQVINLATPSEAQYVAVTTKATQLVAIVSPIEKTKVKPVVVLSAT